MPYIIVYEHPPSGFLAHKYSLSETFNTKQEAEETRDSNSSTVKGMGLQFKEIVELHMPKEVYEKNYQRSTHILPNKYDEFKTQNTEYEAKKEAKSEAPASRQPGK